VVVKAPQCVPAMSLSRSLPHSLSHSLSRPRISPCLVPVSSSPQYLLGRRREQWQ
jgi:hypothetical protein